MPCMTFAHSRQQNADTMTHPAQSPMPIPTHTNLAISLETIKMAAHSNDMCALEISNKNLNTHHHISCKVCTFSLCHSSVRWPLQVVDFFFESSKFSLKSIKLLLMVATTSSSIIYRRQWRIDWS